MDRTLPLVTLLLLALSSVPAHAQGQLLSPDSRASQMGVGCRTFVLNDPSVKGAPQVLIDCLDSVSKVLSEVNRVLDESDDVARVVFTLPVPVDNGKIDLVPNQTLERLDRYLLREHLNVKAMERWARWFLDNPEGIDAPADAGERSVGAAQRARAELDNALSTRGLRRLFSAALMTGAALGSGKPLDDSGGEGEQSASAVTHIAWQSRHFGDDRFNGFDFAFGGKFGFMPALTFVKPDDKEVETPDDNGEGVYQEAFVWDISGRINKSFGGTSSSAEVSVVGAFGQTMLGTQSVLLDRGEASVLAVPIRNGATKSENFFEFGLQYNLYDNPLEVVHGEGSTVSPAFTARFALRSDNRFRKTGELVAFDDPERRLVFGFMIDALKVLDRRDLGEAPKVFTFGFGVEYERPFSSGQTIPAGTKIVFKGDVNLLQALRGR